MILKPDTHCIDIKLEEWELERAMIAARAQRVWRWLNANLSFADPVSDMKNDRPPTKADLFNPASG